MKTLFLLRHASAESGDGPDRERPLAPEGRVEAQAMASCVAAATARPDRILTSDALRALETAAAVSEALGIAPAETDAQLYLASPGEILRCVQDLPDSTETVLIVAHNPGIGSLARALPGEAPEPNRARPSGFPPAALAVVVFPDGDWADVAPGRGRLVKLVRPSDLL